MKNCCILFKYEEMIIYVKLMNFYVNKTRENNFPDFSLPINLGFICYRIKNESRPFI